MPSLHLRWRKSALRENFKAPLSTMETLTITPLNFQYRVVGDTGHTWGHVVVAFKPKDGPLRVSWAREIMRGSGEMANGRSPRLRDSIERSIANRVACRPDQIPEAERPS